MTFTPKLTIGAVLDSKTPAGPKPKYWLSDVPEKDDFGAKINFYFIDGRTRAGYWAIMTPSSWVACGCGKLGTGYGQKYERQTNGSWLKVEG